MSRFRSLLQASVNATKRAFTWNIEEWIPPPEKYIFKFHSKEDLKKWHLYSDSEYGGLSSASLEIPDGGKGSDGTGIFSGNLSVDLSEGSKWNISRSGFCGMRSKKFDGFIDLDGYDAIAMRLRGDGRCYISTIYTENWVNSPGQTEDNSWQAFVFAPKDRWYTAKAKIMSSLECFASSLRPLVTGVLIIYQIPLARYLPTWRGNVIDVEMEMNPGRVLGMSLSVNAEGGVVGAKSGAGDFRVEIDWIKALRMP
ncbi:hypothetical protein IGI04_022424 [Brassica rapa subsp. trilocularis]|uniref:NADH:ubiquinone oxidoreductase intermediate-associated protein 30 domain-containing protein n=1 Tax=Brassica rapa subsp. trilocularis TaxID=1813537 RepID=A0ABQ7M0W3_BRACM|nr:hypothetical protein IGI04_022424 [Brassica rapa subsp. trilocularis]